MRAWSSRVRVIALATVLGGCGLLSGLDSLTVQPDGADGGSSGGGSSSGTSSSGASSSGTSGASSSGTSGASSSGTSGASSSGTTPDAGRDAPATGCGPSQACVPPVPSGWTPVWFTSSSAVGVCGTGYPTAKPVAIASPNSAVCQSNCNPTVDTCGTGSYVVQLGGGAACTVAGLSLSPGSCGTVPGTPAVAANTSIKVTPPAGPNACAATATTPPSSGTSGRVCTGATTGNTCTRQDGGGGVCVPPGNFNGPGACVMGPQNAACPADYPRQYLVADTLTDARTCSAASCGTTPCTGGTLRLYAGGSCNAASDLRQTTDGTCATTTNSAFTAARYEFSPASGCNVTAPAQVTGGTLTYGANPQTVCCTGGN